MDVLVLGGRSFVALEIVRNFGKNGHTVYTAESLRLHPAGWSRYSRKNFHIPSPRFALEAFAESLEKVIEQNNIQLVVPTCEETFYISFLAPRLVAKFPNLRIAAGKYEDVALLHDKFLFSQLTTELDIKTPRTFIVKTHDDIQQVRTQLKDQDLILKLRFSRFGSSVRVVKAEDNIEAIDLQNLEWVCQEFIDGPLLCSYSYTVNGEVTATVNYESPFSAQHGVLTAFRPTENLQVLEGITSIADKLHYTGNLSFDYI